MGAARSTGLRITPRLLSGFIEKAKSYNIRGGSVKGKWHMDYSWSGNLNREQFQRGLERKMQATRCLEQQSPLCCIYVILHIFIMALVTWASYSDESAGLYSLLSLTHALF